MFTTRNLSVLAYANGFTLWHYRGGETPLDTLAGTEFFTNATDLLKSGDIVMVSGREGARVLCVAPGERVSLAPLA